MRLLLLLLLLLLCGGTRNAQQLQLQDHDDQHPSHEHASAQ